MCSNKTQSEIADLQRHQNRDAQEYANFRGIPHYEVTMCTGMNINTVKRLEEGEGGVTFEDGFRYFVYAESHKSKPNLMKKFREAMATYQSEQEQASVVIAQQKQRRSEALRKDFERRKIENTTRQSVQMEMSEKLTSLTTEHDAKTKELETELQEARDQIAAMQKEQHEVRTQIQNLDRVRVIVEL